MFAICGLAIFSMPALANEPSKKSAPHKTHAKHPHKHKKDCGHKATAHGDHTDYEHDGHTHKTHAGHVDECEKTEAASQPKES
jgi:hypothetical protein